MVKICQSCRHPLPESELHSGLTPMQRRIFEALKRAGRRGLTREELMGKVYGDDPDGGPLGMTQLHIHRKRMIPVLQAQGLTIVSTGRVGTYWRLESITDQSIRITPRQGQDDGHQMGPLYSRRGAAARVADPGDGG